MSKEIKSVEEAKKIVKSFVWLLNFREEVKKDLDGFECLTDDEVVDIKKTIRQIRREWKI